jgi:hypothetical protein
MANHITNIVKVTDGDPKVVAEFMKSVEEDGSVRHFDYNKLFKLPEELVNTISPRYVVSDEEFEKLSDEDKTRGQKITQSRHDELMEKYGADNWYDWCCKEWGTKWNAYSEEAFSDDTFIFDSAWAHPYPVIAKLSEKFPDHAFEVKYADEDIGSNFGHYIIKNGDIDEMPIEDEERFCIETKGYDYEDYQEMLKEENE